MAVPGAGDVRWVRHGDGVSGWEDGKVLEMDGADGCAISNVFTATEPTASGWESLWYVCLTTMKTISF